MIGGNQGNVLGGQGANAIPVNSNSLPNSQN
jgi:hypothetical protein